MRGMHIPAGKNRTEESRSDGKRDGVARRVHGLQQTAFGERGGVAACDHDVVEHTDVDQGQRGAQRLGQELVGPAGSATPDGWLCARITAAAFSDSARLTTSRGYTLVLVSVLETFPRAR